MDVLGLRNRQRIGPTYLFQLKPNSSDQIEGARNANLSSLWNEENKLPGILMVSDNFDVEFFRYLRLWRHWIAKQFPYNFSFQVNILQHWSILFTIFCVGQTTSHTMEFEWRQMWNLNWTTISIQHTHSHTAYRVSGAFVLYFTSTIHLNGVTSVYLQHIDWETMWLNVRISNVLAVIIRNMW